MTSKSQSVKSLRSPLPYSLHGLFLPPAALNALQKRGIYCTPVVSIEHQHLAKRYVLRGVESGGAVVDMGRACAFIALDGAPLSWLQSIDTIAVNGRHAIFIAESLVRLEMLRTVRTYELAITLHMLSAVPNHGRPIISSKMLFRGQDGSLAVDLWRDENRSLRGQLAPIFYNRAGEMVSLPRRFEDAICRITGAVCCVGCKHTHLGVPPAVSGATP